MSQLKAKIQEDMKTALKAGEKDRLGTIRLIIAAIRQREIDDQIQMDDAQVTQVLEKMLKQRKDSITQYEAANRQDLADKEKQEIEFIQVYMPAQLSEAEIDQFISQAITETGAAGAQGMGKVMSHLKPLLQGRADMGLVGQKVKTRLG